MELNPFTCTLGEAAKHGLTEPRFNNINELLDHQAQSHGDRPAAGFFQPRKDGASWTTTVYTFRQVRDITTTVAARLNTLPEVQSAQTIALLCPSFDEFMFVWLALIRLDIAVLLIAPQCQPDAIVHLCKECGVKALLYHGVYETLAKESCQKAKDANEELRGRNLAEVLGGSLEAVLGNSQDHSDAIDKKSEAGLGDIAYIHHTSGTSSGLPKPIPQAHNAAVGALPKLRDAASKATFTTTPLYHGGIADAFRSWTSGALIWLHPGKDVPIIGTNIIKALEAAARTSEQDQIAPIAYFSCVPYVLQLLEEEPQGLDWLRKMDIVGVGGAALPNDVGDRLVKSGVNLVSRFGSSECGFMMSSHRDYAKDKSWQYLRDNVGPSFLRFEPRDDGLSELVVLPSWPHRAKKNRDDGSFATADLFEAHSSIPNAWRYHSRADSQLTLITGKKFDPAPLEGTLADSNLISDALIFGNGRPYPGVLIFRSQESKEVSDDELINGIWNTLQNLNAGSQDHSRIAKEMVKPMPWQSEPLEKSSKGTLIRKKVEARFADDIEAAYSEKDSNSNAHISDSDIEDHVLKTVKETLARSEKLDLDTDLFAYGVDSIAAMRIRGRLQGLLGEGKALPATVVETYGTPRKIGKFIVDLRNGKKAASDGTEELKLMRDLVEEYSNFQDAELESSANGDGAQVGESRETVLLTGATGALGAHVLDLCTKNARVRKVICLIRGEGEHAARGRLDKAFEGRMLHPLVGRQVEVEVLPAKIGDSKLGLEDEVYDRLARDVTVIVHLAWEVNFRMNLRSFRSNSIAGVTNLIHLALASHRQLPPRFAFCSSVASVMNHNGSISERPSDDPNDASPLGYSRSKWVAEQICLKAADQTKLKGRISILRVGQLAGDTGTGVWNEKEAWPMMLSTVKLVKALPEIKDEPLNWLPVNIAAQAFVDAAVEDRPTTLDDIEVIHVLNQHRETTWMDLLGWLRKEISFETLPPAKWIEKLEEQQAKGVDHPAFRLIGLWKENLCKDNASDESNEASKSAPHFETIRSVRAAPVLADVEAVKEEYFKKIWGWIDSNL